MDMKQISIMESHFQFCTEKEKIKNNILFPKFGENMSWNEKLLNRLNVIIYLVDCTYVKKNVLEINVPWEILLLCFRSNSNCQEKNERNKGKGEKEKENFVMVINNMVVVALYHTAFAIRSERLTPYYGIVSVLYLIGFGNASSSSRCLDRIFFEF